MGRQQDWELGGTKQNAGFCILIWNNQSDLMLQVCNYLVPLIILLFLSPLFLQSREVSCLEVTVDIEKLKEQYTGEVIASLTCYVFVALNQ